MQDLIDTGKPWSLSPQPIYDKCFGIVQCSMEKQFFPRHPAGESHSLSLFEVDCQ